MELKPVVDGIESDVQGRAVVVRVDLLSEGGSAIGKRYGVEFTPTFLLFDRRGAAIESLRSVSRGAVVSRLSELSD
ncbi:MAG TPA: hypothetical protein VJQ09_06365 [Candidatus Limnocylindria bacterium]|nr:hypothetical protein [Candidatus Limnocylindria bacterium]